MIRSPIILASASPRRADLLHAAGVAFSVVPSQGMELDDPDLSAIDLVLANARSKALEVASIHPKSIVIGADTLVCIDGRALGKPTDLAEARSMLATLSGRIHEVVTAVHIVRLEPLQQIEFYEVTRVKFRSLDADAISDYLSCVDVLDKAGAYALQESGELIVESVEGNRSNVVGLPLDRTIAALQRFAS